MVLTGTPVRALSSDTVSEAPIGASRAAGVDVLSPSGCQDVLDAGVVPRVVVVTDSTAGVIGLPPDAELRIVPVTLLFTDGEASDLDVDPADVYARLARHE